ncbi:hypothetical protein niasHT_033390 [Heterodera trifolii]|uniref:Extracellular solute-binding protein n=1 Tax=Heterodera trifolii TaxID=157864 RepID=A0ABD2I9H8_9BILA
MDSICTNNRFSLLMPLLLLVLIAAQIVPGTFAKKHSKLSEETRTLDQLYAAALKEGGRLIVYAGGDTAGQQDGFKNAFEKRFPNITLDVVVDYSKFHGPRIDYQIDTNTLVPDVVQLQTLQEFPRWKAMGVLMPYKPAGWSAIYKDYRDKHGYFTGIFVDSFSNIVNSKLMPTQKDWPREASDYLKPAFSGQKLVVTYPTDDDAVLFWFKQVVDIYGWQWVAKFGKQQPIWVRGTQDPADLVENGTALASMSTDGMLKPGATMATRFVLPNKDPIVIWAQQAAIFKKAKHPETAKLYLNWVLDKDTQANVWYMWSVRKDVPPPEGFRQSWEYTKLSSHKAFAKFLSDREAVERFRLQVFLHLGEAQGPPSPGLPGILPDKALPH